MDDFEKLVEDFVAGPCLHCQDNPSPSDRQHVAMPVTRPKYVDNYLEQLAPGEEHALDPESHCVNPKCDYYFTPQDEEEIEQNKGEFTCPKCGTTYNYLRETPTYGDWGEWEEGGNYPTKGRPANPGGNTRAGLTLDQMGQIGEKIVLRMGELPGLGSVQAASDSYNFPIDVIVTGQNGRFGCEVKTNHSQAQERFKIGGQCERQQKITYCLENGLKPALIGVRLNFYTDKAYVFFREGLTDTWIGNSKMRHVATLDFADLNPYRSPDPQAQALAVDNAHLPDQSEEPDADLDAIFGPTQKAASEDFEQAHPRDETGKFTVKSDIHKLKVKDSKGKHTHDVIRCKHCGSANWVPVDHRGRKECSSCGQDPERDLKLAKVVLTISRAADLVAKQAGWEYSGRNNEGHRVYSYRDPQGIQHNAIVGAGRGSRMGDLDAQYLRQRINKCMTGKCMHGPADSDVRPIAPAGSPVLRAGQVLNGKVVLEIDGGLALIQDVETGAEDVVPVNTLNSPS